MKLKSKIHIRKAEKFIQRFHSFIKTIAKFKNKLGIGTTPVTLSRGFSQPAFSGFPTFYQNKDSTQWERCSLNRNRCVLLNITFHILIFPRVVTPMFFNYEKCIRENRKKYWAKRMYTHQIHHLFLRPTHNDSLMGCPGLLDDMGSLCTGKPQRFLKKWACVLNVGVTWVTWKGSYPSVLC